MDDKRMYEYKMLGLNIAYYRKLRGLSQMELAEKVDLSRTYISCIEAPNVTTSISLESLLNIADVLDVPASKLLNFTPLDDSNSEHKDT